MPTTPLYDDTIRAEGIVPDPGSLTDEEIREARMAGVRLFLVPFIRGGLGSLTGRLRDVQPALQSGVRAGRAAR